MSVDVRSILLAPSKLNRFVAVPRAVGSKMGELKNACLVLGRYWSFIPRKDGSG